MDIVETKGIDYNTQSIIKQLVADYMKMIANDK